MLICNIMANYLVSEAKTITVHLAIGLVGSLSAILLLLILVAVVYLLWRRRKHTWYVLRDIV